MSSDKVLVLLPIKSLRGAPIGAKRECLEALWEKWKAENDWRPTRRRLEELAPAAFYCFAIDQAEESLSFMKMALDDLTRWEEATSDKLVRPGILKLHAARKIPVLLHYWADPKDEFWDDDVVVLAGEVPEGTAHA